MLICYSHCDEEVIRGTGGSLAAGGIQVGVDGPHGAVVGNHAKRGVEGVDEFHDGQRLGVLAPALAQSIVHPAHPSRTMPCIASPFQNFKPSPALLSLDLCSQSRMQTVTPRQPWITFCSRLQPCMWLQMESANTKSCAYLRS